MESMLFWPNIEPSGDSALFEGLQNLATSLVMIILAS